MAISLKQRKPKKKSDKIAIEKNYKHSAKPRNAFFQVNCHDGHCSMVFYNGITMSKAAENQEIPTMNPDF